MGLGDTGVVEDQVDISDIDSPHAPNPFLKVGDFFTKNKKQILGALGVIALVAVIPLGVYLVQQKQIFKPKASEVNSVSRPEASFSLQGPTTASVGGQIKVSVLVRSDIDAANLFTAKLQFPANLLKVEEVNVASSSAVQGVNIVQFCAQVITRACDLRSTECKDFPTPCDVPVGWVVVTGKDLAPTPTPSRYCAQVITRACSPDALPICEDFGSPCDVPAGWTTSRSTGDMCAQVITMACNPQTSECREFPTPCDVPAGWSSPTNTPAPTAIAPTVPPTVTNTPAPSPTPTPVPLNKDFFVQRWVEKTYDNNVGTVSLVGGVFSPGFKSVTGQPSRVMVEITFTTLAEGNATISFADDSAIYRNSDNQNILETKRDLGLIITSPTPTPVPTGDPYSSYYLEHFSSQNIFVPAPTTSDYVINALLKDGQDRVITDQSGLVYNWTVEVFGGSPIASVTSFSSCTNGIQVPCPNDHAKITVPALGPTSSTNIKLTVAKASGYIIAETKFYLQLVSPENYVTFTDIYPNGGVKFNVGQIVPIRWNLVGNPVDYYNLGYQYYENGQLKGGYIGTVQYGTNSYNWTVPAVLAGKRAKISISPNKNSIVGGQGLSANYFAIVNTLTPTPIPTTTPVPPISRVFVTSTSYYGNLGGLAGADAKCQARADAANLGGVWKAWLSDSTTAVVDRFAQSNNPYKLLDGTIIANNWWDLVKGSIQNPIDVTEFKQKTTGFVWTNTTALGGKYYNSPANTCQDFTANSYASFPGTGFAGYSDRKWTNHTNPSVCNMPMVLYCFEQGSFTVGATSTTSSGNTANIVVSDPSPTPTPVAIRGDVNNDGKISITDLSALLSSWGKTGSAMGRADINKDGTINVSDYTELLGILFTNGVIKNR